MDSGGGNGAGCFEVKIWTDTGKFTDVTEKVRCSSKIQQRLRAEWVEYERGSSILESCCLSPIRRNSILEEIRVGRLAVFYAGIKRSVVERFVSESCWSGNLLNGRKRRVVCHLHKVVI